MEAIGITGMTMATTDLEASLVGITSLPWSLYLARKCKAEEASPEEECVEAAPAWMTTPVVLAEVICPLALEVVAAASPEAGAATKEAIVVVLTDP
jgi:hypothetical protein